MKHGMLCLLLLMACSYFSDESRIHVYGLTWMCLSPEGCERTDELELLDRLDISDHDYLFKFWSTRSDFSEWGDRVTSDSLPPGCSWLYSFTLFTHELEPSKLCFTAGGLTLELSIPNRAPAIQSKWRVEGRDLGPKQYGAVEGASQEAP